MASGMARLRFMQGEWDVKADVMGADGAWTQTPFPSETTILPVLDGACHREEMSVAHDGGATRLFFSWSYDKYRKIYRMVSCDDAEGLMSVMEGRFEDNTDTVVIDDAATGTATLDADGQPIFRRLASTKTSENSFTDIVSESYDGGRNWLPVFRAVHTRKPAAASEKDSVTP